MLKDPKEIKNYQLKAKFLRANGWVDHWYPDNWVPVKYFDDPTIDVDRAGCSTQSACWSVINEIKRQKYLDEINSR